MFKLGNMLFGLLIIGLCLLGLYIICKLCNENDKPPKPNENERLMMKPVYAHEIEPGIVILQNEEGDYFKILKEYDSKTDNMYGSVSCTKPKLTQPPSRMPVGEFDLMPSSTSMQQQASVAASAPPRIQEPQGYSEMNDRKSVAQTSFGYGTYEFPPPYASN